MADVVHPGLYATLNSGSSFTVHWAPLSEEAFGFALHVIELQQQQINGLKDRIAKLEATNG